MSAYNEDEFEFKRAIESILAQTYKEFELILILDNPKNRILKKIASEYKLLDDRVLVIENSENIGLASSLNKAISHSRYPYIARMDADDYSYPNRFEKELDVIWKGADMVFSRFNFVDEEGNLLKNSLPIPSESEIIRKILKYKNIISHPTVMMRKELLESVGGYSDLKIVEDFELWYRISLTEARMVGLNDILLDYTIRKNSMTTSNYYRAQMAGAFIRKSNAKSKEIKKVTNRDYEEWYEKNKKFENHYNKYAKKYYDLINEWPKYNKNKYFILLYILGCDPRLIKIITKTFISNNLRGK